MSTNIQKDTQATTGSGSVQRLVSCECSLRTRLVGDGCSICNPELAEELEAENIETEAADKSYECGFGVSEWESFLTKESGARLAELARNGRGTWGKEGRIPASFNTANVGSHLSRPTINSTNENE